MSDAEAPEKKPKLKKLLILGGGGLLVLALLGGGGFYGWRYWQARKAAKEAEAAAKPPAPEGHGGEEEEEPTEEGGEGAAGQAVFVYKNNVNLDGRKNAYLVVQLDILFRDQELGKLVTSDKPTPENSIMKALILDTLSGKTLEEMTDVEARETLRQDILERLNEKFAPKPPKEGEEEDPEHKKPKKPIKDVLVVGWAIAQ